MTDVLDNAQLRQQLRNIAAESGQTAEEIHAIAEEALEEMRSWHGKYAARIFASISRYLCRRAYHKDICFDVDELQKIKTLMARQSVVFLVTHKTYLDFFVLYDFVYRNGMTPPYIFGGINMAFAGFGNLARRAGGIFIRRSFRDDPVYRAVLRRYIAYLVEQGSSFMWAIEGTRSRTGKLVLPKLGLLKYVVDATRGHGEAAICYLPVSVSYDQIPDVIDMTAQESGATKKPESLSWFVRYVRRLGGRFGNIYVRFGDKIGLHDTPDAPDLDPGANAYDNHSREIQKLAFEVCYRINEITPATSTSLVLMSLLCRTSASAAQIDADVTALRNHISSRQSSALFIQPSRDIEFDTGEALESLLRRDVVQLNRGGGSRLSIVPKNYLVALYYSNMAVHHFVLAAFTELGLLGVAQTRPSPGAADFWTDVMRLRDVFKFEFFFARKEQFRHQVGEELAYIGVAAGSADFEDRPAVAAVLDRQPLLIAHGVLSPYIHAYRVVADCLVRACDNAVVDRAAFVTLCQAESRHAGTGAGYPGFASRTLLGNALALAGNRNLLDGGAGTVALRREFDEELRELAGRLDEIRRRANSLSLSSSFSASLPPASSSPA